ncbi:MAG: DUF1013 domain-containing protein [Rickettsiaceae bacterium]|nr:DUF1013 domain-containing protein [Rickettsiaceae bacterium]
MTKKIPIMPKATAVWLVENTGLTFKQIADFCGMHELEVKGIADGEVAQGIIGMSPVVTGQLTEEEISRASADPKVELHLSVSVMDSLAPAKKKNTKYTPVARRHEKPDAIYWLLKQCPNIQDAQITKLIGTTKSTIAAIRDRSHWNIKNLRPRDPVLLGICSQSDLDKILDQQMSHSHPLSSEEGGSSSDGDFSANI